MSEIERSDSTVASHLPGQVDEKLRQYCRDPQAPRLEEVRQLVEEVLLRNAELESKAANLRKIVHQLEAFRDRYVDLYELAPVGYATLDEEAYIQEINLAGSELLGRARNELIGYPLGQYVHPAQRAEFLDRINNCCCRRQVLTFEAGLLTAFDRLVTVHIRGVPVEPLAGGGAFCKIALTDITERKMAEEAIRASEANYRAVFDTANDAIFVHDIDTGRILDANQKATEMYGYTAEEFQQVSVEALSEGHVPYSQAEASRWLGLAAAGAPQLFTWKAKNKSGNVFWTEVNLKRTALNGVPRLLAIVRDITDRHPADRLS